uniref:Uncharacterized protein n=1 Tax=Amphimedon queenslandica TaxID=400682 RepID=A0A1X7TP64_AMPQE
AMSLLLVVVLLFFSSSSIVSSAQYYVSDDCSSVTQSPCNPLSVYARNMSQYNNTIFYFIGNSSISNHDIKIITVKNVTLHGLDQSPSINCNGDSIGVSLQYSDDVNSSNNVTITKSVFTSDPDMPKHLVISNAFDVKILSSIFTNAYVVITYSSDPAVCPNELHHYSLTLTNVTLKDSRMKLHMKQHTSYNVSVIFDHVKYSYSVYNL